MGVRGNVGIGGTRNVGMGMVRKDFQSDPATQAKLDAGIVQDTAPVAPAAPSTQDMITSAMAPIMSVLNPLSAQMNAQTAFNQAQGAANTGTTSAASNVVNPFAPAATSTAAPINPFDHHLTDYQNTTNPMAFNPTGANSGTMQQPAGYNTGTPTVGGLF